MSKHTLLESTDLRGLSLPNRIALAPMTRGRAGSERLANAMMAEHYAQRSGGSGAGLIITEATVVSAQGNGWVNSPGIYTDEMGAAWKQVTEAVHDAGSKVFLQMWHCGRAAHSSFLNGGQPVAPSAIAISDGSEAHTASGKQPFEMPRALDASEIPGIVQDYVAAAERARAAGFDGVEVHAANGYLLDEFLQSKTNQRTDEYGGSVANRYRILKEVVEAVIQVFPADRVGVRLAPNGMFNDMGSDDFRETFTFVAKELDGYGLAYLHVMDGLAFGFHEKGEAMKLDEFRAVFSGPLIGNCGYGLEDAQTAIDEGSADLISIGRPFIGNPDLADRYRNDWPIAESDMATWYASPDGKTGYTDYPRYS